MKIYTIGHSSRTFSEMLQILQIYHIETVVDVRRYPQSKRFPHFNRVNLEKALKSDGIQYNWLGELLGGFRKEDYTEYVKTDAFVNGIHQFIKIAGNTLTGLMCSELNWSRCHRQFIADYLVKMGYNVTHIMNEHQKSKHTLRVVDNTRESILPDFLR